MSTYERSLARFTDPATSKAAARATSSFRSKHIGLIYYHLKRVPGGATKDELAVLTGLDATQIARRLSGMEAGSPQLVIRTSETRDSPSGRKCIVWKAI